MNKICGIGECNPDCCEISMKEYADEKVRELLDEVMQKSRTIITEDGVMYRVVFLKDIEDMKGELNNNDI